MTESWWDSFSDIDDEDDEYRIDDEIEALGWESTANVRRLSDGVEVVLREYPLTSAIGDPATLILRGEDVLSAKRAFVDEVVGVKILSLAVAGFTQEGMLPAFNHAEGAVFLLTPSSPRPEEDLDLWSVFLLGEEAAQFQRAHAGNLAMSIRRGRLRLLTGNHNKNRKYKRSLFGNDNSVS